MGFIPQNIRNRRGFTMIEVICALMVLGIIAAISVSRRVATPAELIVELETLKSHLRYAQYKAMSDLPGTTWGILLNNGSYTLYKDGAAATIGLPGEQSGTPPRTHTYSGGVTMTSVTPADINAATFDFLGRPVDASSNPLNGNVGITLSRMGVTMTLAHCPQHGICAMSLNLDNRRGFTLLEVIVVLVIAAVLGTIMVAYMGRSFTLSGVPVTRLDSAGQLRTVVENITADFGNPAIFPSPITHASLVTLKDRINNNPNNLYGTTYTVLENKFIRFDASHAEQDDVNSVTLKVKSRIIWAKH